MKHNHLLLLALALIMVLAAACSPAAPVSVTNPSSEQAQTIASTVAPAVTVAPTAIAREMPTMMATEMPTMVATEPPAAQPASTGNFPIGKFVSVHDKAIGVKYNQDGTFEFYFASKDPAFVGTYSVEGDQITTENPSETDPKCIGPATYKWSFDGVSLTFAPIKDDSCRGRREANADTYVLEQNYLPEISIDAADFSYTAPDKISEGWVRVKLTNTGLEPHHVQFLRLNDGVTLAQFEEALKQGEGPAMALVKQMGGVGAIAPTLSAQAVLNLPAGEYVILCLIPSPSDHVAHVAKGMIKSLAVQPTIAENGAEPSADLTVRLQDYSFDMPDALPAGQTTIKVVNEGPEPHEFNLLKLADGKTAEDVRQFLAKPNGPPPFTPVGGMNGLDVGSSGYVEYDFQPGSYVAICNIPSPKAEGHPHFALGMIKQFSVAP